MRSKDAARLFDVIEALQADAAAQRAAFDAERAEWAKERKFLLNASLAATSLEFSQRQRATATPAPISSVPVEPKGPKPRPLGL